MATIPSTRNSTNLTLKDRLSRLTYPLACSLLGARGVTLLRQGGDWEIEIESQVPLGDDLFRLRLHNAVVTITLMSEARARLR